MEMYVSFVNLKSNNGLVYQIDTKQMKDDVITQVIKLQVLEGGKHEFKAFYSDCYGVSKKDFL